MQCRPVEIVCRNGLIGDDISSGRLLIQKRDFPADVTGTDLSRDDMAGNLHRSRPLDQKVDPMSPSTAIDELLAGLKLYARRLVGD